MMKNKSHFDLLSGMLLLLLATVYWLYSLGFDAGFQFDDLPNMGGLSRVQDWQSALAYVFEGRAGPGGRPLAFASFVLQKDSWPDDPAAFFLVNTLIHLLNGVLVYFFVRKLLNPSLGSHQCNPWMALTVTALWLVTPLLVSASLAAVQRMTTLASTFILMGLVGYLHGRSLLQSAPKQAYRWMSVALVLGTGLALLCKEIGIMLPVYVSLLETTVLRDRALQRLPGFRRWAAIFLVLPVLLILAYFVYAWPGFMRGYATRNFTFYERLLTETRILWDYFGQILIPARSGTGPYQDDYPISKGLFDPTSTVVAIASWVVLLAGSWRLRDKLPWVWFGLLWFLLGHILESSFIPLELYFEHRNYLPALGPLLAVSVLLWKTPEKVFRPVMAGLALIVLLRLFVLGETTHSWGQPLLSARLWVEEHPLSARAAQHLTRVYFYAGDEEASVKATLDGHTRIKDDISLALQALQFSCPREDETAYVGRLATTLPMLATGVGINSIAQLLSNLLDEHQKGACPHLQFIHMHQIADSLLTNPRVQMTSGILAAVHVFKYRLYALEGKPNYSIRELVTAFGIRHEVDIAVAAALAMANAGHPQDALAFLEKSRAFMPRNPLFQREWQDKIDKMRDAIKTAVDAAPKH